VRQTVVFVTDFGLEDGYAAELRAATWSAAPGVRCVDGTHLVPPGDVITGAYACKRLARSFGPGSVICAVVDPGVGGDRPALAAMCDGVLCVAPDTGLVSYLWMEAEAAQAVRLPTPEPASPTFHGRDLFAPVAARLAAGAALAGCGEPLDQPRLLGELRPSRSGSRLRSQVVAVDHFGNCVTGVRPSDVGAGTPVGMRWPGGETTRMVRTYADIEGGLGLLWNSAGHLELAARGSPAAPITGLGVGSPVEVELG
jgi:S-adenosylmethionine hydrolase